MRKALRILMGYIAYLEAKAHSWFIHSSPFSSYLYDRKNAEEFKSIYQHEAMLADSERVEKYFQGIQKNIKAGDIVVDIGAGTGILSFFAARSADTVYAVEHAEVIEVAKKICEANEIKNIKFLKCNSRDLNLPGKADVILHEQIGGENPLSENMIANLLDARRRLLKPGGRIVPGKFEIFIEPIQLKDEYVIPFIWEMQIKHIDFKSMLPSSGPMSGHKITRHQRRTIGPTMVERCLCDPKPIIRFDLEVMNEDDIPKRLHYNNIAVRDGRIDGLCIYFKAIFDDEIFIETAPTAPVTSWEILLYRMEQSTVVRGQAIEYELEIESILDDSTWAFTWLRPQAEAK